jgi:hypothetical protein
MKMITFVGSQLAHDSGKLGGAAVSFGCHRLPFIGIPYTIQSGPRRDGSAAPA